MKPRLWPIVLASALGIAILLGLGVWQVKRLAWKEQLIAELNDRMKSEPTMLTENYLGGTYGSGVIYPKEYFKFKADGHFVGNNPFRMIAATDGSPGWRIVHTFVSTDGVTLLVDRGISLNDKIEPMPNKEIEVIGLVRLHDQGRGFFDPENDPVGNYWYWWDHYEMAHNMPDDPKSGYAPEFFLQLLPGSPGTEGLFVATPKVELANNHLGYAITWFGLAAALAAVAGFYVFSLRKTKA